jgi:uncharacterized protein (UPF0333 family)
MFPIPSALLIKAGIVLAVCAVFYFMGYSHEHKKFVAFKAEVAAIGKAQEVLNEAKVKEHEVISTAIANQYEARLSAVHNYYVERVQPNSGSGSVSTVSKPTVCANAAPTDTEFTRQCAETTLMLTELQNWIKSIK